MSVSEVLAGGCMRCHRAHSESRGLPRHPHTGQTHPLCAANVSVRVAAHAADIFTAVSDHPTPLCDTIVQAHPAKCCAVATITHSRGTARLHSGLHSAFATPWESDRGGKQLHQSGPHCWR
jgi:hypothetical protein